MGEKIDLFLQQQATNRICVIGNACSGKTTLSRKLATQTNLPLFHVDAVQFLPEMRLRDPDETRTILTEIADKPNWIIDGLGPLKIIESRLRKADLIICIQISLPLIYWFCFKRQIKGIFYRREELPENCFESTLPQTLKLIRTIWNVHHGFWKQMNPILLRPEYRDKVLYVKSAAELKNFYLKNLQ